jgi:hypothetical protein
LQIKQGELELKKQKMQIDGAARVDELNLKKQELESKMEMDMVKITEQNKVKTREMQIKEQLEGTRIGVDIAKTKDMMRKKSKGE